MIGWLLVAHAWAAPAVPVHLDADAAIGMRMGVAVTATAEPVRHLEVGGLVTVMTPLYAGAPGWVREGLTVDHNVHASPMVALGVNTGTTKVSGAFHVLAGFDVVSFSERRSLDAVGETTSYATTEVVWNGGLMGTLRVLPKGPVGFNLQVFVPLPPAATGAPDIGRLFGGLGVSARWGASKRSRPERGDVGASNGTLGERGRAARRPGRSGVP